MTEEKKRIFEAEAVSVLAGSIGGKPKSRIARLLVSKPDPSRQVAVQFNDLDAASSQEAWDTSDRAIHDGRSRAA